LDSNSWGKELDRLLRTKARPISYRNSSASSRRISGQHGSPRKFYGYRTILLYFQLNPNYNIDTNDLYYILNLFTRYTDTGKAKIRRFLPLYFNNEEYKLMYPDKLVNNETMIVKNRIKNFDEYAKDYYQYSKILKELYPDYTVYAKKRFPSENDLCVFFYEKGTLKVKEDIKEEIEKYRENTIWISLEDEEIINISEEIPQIVE